MSTSDLRGGAPSVESNPTGTSALDFAAMVGEVSRIANEFFAGLSVSPDGSPSGEVPPASLATPGVGAQSAGVIAPPVSGPTPVLGPLPPPRVGPSAANVGGGGLSGAATQPPTPGVFHTPPLAASPFPKEADVRPAPTLLAELFGGPTPLELMLSADSRTPSSTPYFLEHAGLPNAPSAAPLTPSAAAPQVAQVPSTSLPLAPSSAPLPGSFPAEASPAIPAGALPSSSALSAPSVPSPAAPIGLPPQPGFGAAPSGLPYAPSSTPPVPAFPGGALPPAPNFGNVVSGPVSALPGGAPPSPVAIPERTTPEALARPALSSAIAPSDGYSPELVPDLGASRGIFDAHAIKQDFPILEERVHGTKRLIWLDNAATTQKPRAVIERLSYFYEHENSNIHRAAHTLAARATDAYEGARERVRRFLNASTAKEIVFTRGATEAINLVAKSWGARNVKAGDEIVLTVLEHHANIVPWQQLAAEKGAKIRVAPVDSNGQIILEEYEKLFNPRTRIASFTQVSNALGTITPARDMVEIAHRHGALALVDGAQTVSHQRVDVQDLDADFYVFSGHKVFGPTGIGALFGKAAVLEHMPPWQGGGNMIADVTFEKTVYQPPPFRFEAGTGNIADAVGLGAAIDYVMGIGLENIARYEHELLVYATEGLCRVPGLTLIGTAPDKAGVLSFVLDGRRTEDVGAALDKEGIAVRSGHHCAQPILRRFGLEATVRASLAPYNTKEDIDDLVAAVTRLQSR
ncbi:MAG TPA: family 2A encapsulin nanocompartment cargo protein cysteine desulfurase [Polyangiaceae bacterium]|nr:family 2A encapsulin nanocompartment cargo protein cysteine desulfurase [Polyangiaceae bacterium]